MRLAAVSVALAVLVSPLAAAQPPARPTPLTPAQFSALQQLEREPANAAVLGVRATYQSERERSLEFTTLSDDFWTAAAYIGYPGFILGLLICAGPY